MTTATVTYIGVDNDYATPPFASAFGVDFKLNVPVVFGFDQVDALSRLRRNPLFKVDGDMTAFDKATIDTSEKDYADLKAERAANELATDIEHRIEAEGRARETQLFIAASQKIAAERAEHDAKLAAERATLTRVQTDDANERLKAFEKRERARGDAAEQERAIEMARKIAASAVSGETALEGDAPYVKRGPGRPPLRASA